MYEAFELVYWYSEKELSHNNFLIRPQNRKIFRAHATYFSSYSLTHVTLFVYLNAKLFSMHRFNILIPSVLAIVFANATAQTHSHDHIEHVAQLEFIQNNGQWNSNAQFMADLNGGKVWIESGGFTYDFLNPKHIQRMHEENHGDQPYSATSLIDGHVFKMKFLGNKKPIINGNLKQPLYHNYFIGNDRTKWAPKAHVFHEVAYKELYEGIGLTAYSHAGHFKYDYHIGKGGDPDQIRFTYEGAEGVSLKDGNLDITTSVGDIVEQAPYAYQVVGIRWVEVECKYMEGEDGAYGFFFPNGFNPGYKLVIDPTVIAATYSGSTSSVYGHTATYDAAGNIYSGGAGFSGGGYPTTTGAYQETPAGSREYTITKYNPDGSAQVWATHLGGTSEDYPHSMVVNDSNQLYVLGSSNSANYPTSTTAYSTSNSGSYDIVVSALSSDGASLIASTYIGGSNIDGQNSIYDNYGDDFKGDIFIDPNGDVYIASMSQSTDFPTTSGAIQPTSGGSQDGVVIKLPADLSSLTWSTYLGGTGDDAAYSVVSDSNDDVYVSGTASTGYLTTAGTFAPIYLGGTADGFVSHIANDGATLLASSFIGTSGRDQAFFVQVDKFDQVFVNGQSDGGMTSSSGCYSGPSTGSFIQQLTSDLTTLNFTSTYGRMAPTAFLVDNCNNIYAAGHGGLSPLGTTGFDASVTAFDTDGAGFYLMVLDPNASGLNFGTFYGNDGAHVDGGTSRFDPQGVVYENVCSSSGSPTMPWAWATGTSAGWDSYVYKIDFEASGVTANANANDLIACTGPPFDVDFTGSSGVPNHFWDFGDGTGTSTLANPTYTYADTGTYNIMYVVIDSTTCNVTDTAYATIEVILPATFNAVIDVGPWDPCSPSDSLLVELNFTGTGADSIVWDMGDGTVYLGDSVNHWYVEDSTYIITMTAYDNLCGNTGIVTDTVSYGTGGFDVDVSIEDFLSCTPAPFDVDFTGDPALPDHYWDFGDGSPGSILQDPTHTYVDTGTYNIMYVGIDSASCNIADTAYATISITEAEQFAADWQIIPPAPCEDTLYVDISFSGSGADSIFWDMDDGSTFINDTSIQHTYYIAGTYTVSMTAWDFICDNTETITQTFTHDPFLGYGIIGIPNVFSPNGDSDNEMFRVFYIGQPGVNPFPDIEKYKIQIYNRWGLMVFESGDTSAEWEWDGTDRSGQDVVDGVYFYTLSYKYFCDEVETTDITGHITIVR